MLIGDIEELTRCSVDKTILLANRENVFFKTKIFEPIVDDASDFQTFFTNLRVDMVLSIFIEQATNLSHLRVHIPTVLTAEKSIERLELIKCDDAIAIKVTCMENLMNILQFLSLQLVRSMNHELSELI